MRNADGEIATGEMERGKQSAREERSRNTERRKLSQRPALDGKEQGGRRGRRRGAQGDLQAWEGRAKPGNYGVAGHPGQQFAS